VTRGRAVLHVRAEAAGARATIVEESSMMSTFKTGLKWVGLYLLAQLIGGLVEVTTGAQGVGTVVTAVLVTGFIIYARTHRQVRAETTTATEARRT
jgi:hypothetical protein